jgi:deazaflavin-dependent oxidoreductase (nitroreductase family)
VNVTAAPRRGVVKTMLRAPVHLYRWHAGWLLGHRFLLLTHRGRRTGAVHQTVLEVLRYDKARREAIVMSGFGRSADWLRNLQAGSPAEIQTGRECFPASSQLVDEVEAVGVLASFERRNRIARPVVRAVLSRLLGWRYLGTDHDRRRAVAQLPLVRLAPDERTSRASSSTTT